MESPETRASLLIRLRDVDDAEAWSRFVEIYGPLIWSVARRSGLQDADAADVSQEVLRRVAKAMPRFEYDRERGSFRGWLLTIARHQIRDFFARSDRRGGKVGGETVAHIVAHLPAEDELERAWQSEYEQAVFRWAAGELRPTLRESTWEAFRRTALLGESASEAGLALGMTPGAVYVARCRVTAKLRELVDSVREE